MTQSQTFGDQISMVPYSIFQFLPPAYEVWVKVIFILGNVCLFTTGGGGEYPSKVQEGESPSFQMGVPPSFAMGGYAHPSQWGRHPILPNGVGGRGTQNLPNGGYPHLANVGGGTSSSPDRSYPTWPIGVPQGILLVRTGLGSGLHGAPPSQDWMAHQDWLGVPPPLSGDRATEQGLATRRAVCLLRSRRRTFLFKTVTNCVGISCVHWIFSTCFCSCFKVMEKSRLVDEFYDFIHLQPGYANFGKIYWNYSSHLAQGAFW